MLDISSAYARHAKGVQNIIASGYRYQHDPRVIREATPRRASRSELKMMTVLACAACFVDGYSRHPPAVDAPADERAQYEAIRHMGDDIKAISMAAISSIRSSPTPRQSETLVSVLDRIQAAHGNGFLDTVYVNFLLASLSDMALHLGNRPATARMVSGILELLEAVHYQLDADMEDIASMEEASTIAARMRAALEGI